MSRRVFDGLLASVCFGGIFLIILMGIVATLTHSDVWADATVITGAATLAVEVALILFAIWTEP